MKYDEKKVDEMVLALMYLVMHDGSAWKGFDWDSLDRLHEKGLISNPRTKTKSVRLTLEGEQRSEELFKRHFEIKNDLESS